MAGTRSKAASTKPAEADAKHRDPNVPPGTHPDAVPGPARTTEQIDAERRRVQPHAVSGPGAGNRLLKAPEFHDDGRPKEQEEASLENVVDDDPASAMVVVGEDVYEEVPAPGAPNRKIQRLLYRKGRTVKKAELDRALKAQRDAAKKDDAADDGNGGSN